MSEWQGNEKPAEDVSPDTTAEASSSGDEKKKKPKKKRGKFESFLTLLAILLCLCVLGYSLYQVLTILSDYRAGKNEYDELSSLAEPSEETVLIEIPADRRTPIETDAQTGEAADPDDSPQTDDATEAETEAPPQKVAVVIPTVNFPALKAINPEVGAWISLSGTNINYPVTFPKDNVYYVTHTYKGQENHSGCIFMDCRCDDADSDRNVILYGHNMKNRTMFGQIKQYANQSFYDTHPTPVFVTEKETYLVLIFSAYTTNVKEDAWQTYFADDAAYDAWLQKITRRSRIRCDAVPTTRDRVITLSTCSDATGDGRFVAHGILVPINDLTPSGG